MQFSKLDDTEFPYLENASPYALKNTFDYSRWVPGTKVHMVNVPWNNDYSNVVKFDNDVSRNSWFDSISDDYIVELKSNARMIPDGSIKIPLPYDVAARYDYMYIEIPLATSKDSFIENETESGYRRWYFFVNQIIYSAPNTTTVILQLDIWTQFINTTDINYMMLERGHAPMAITDADTYLSNPIGNNRYLLAPDVNYDDSDIVRSSKYIPVGSGEKYVVFASTCGYDDAEDKKYGDTKDGDRFTNPTYSDAEGWYGEQLEVSGYGFGNGIDYSGLESRASIWPTPRYLSFAGYLPYAVKASDTTFIKDLRNISPTFMRTIRAIWVVGEDMISLGAEMNIAGHSVWRAYGVDNVLKENIVLDKSLFGFDSECSDFAKLYTYPYSKLEFSDGSGKTAEVRIENTSSIGVRMFTSMAWPTLDCRVFFEGVNGTGKQSYIWKNMMGDELQREVPNGDWAKLAFELDIPTYALYMDGETDYMLDNYNAMQNAKNQALLGYHNAIRNANLGYKNTTNINEMVKANADRTANTSQAVSKNSAGTAQYNANQTANLNCVNMKNTAKAASQNVVWNKRSTLANAEEANYSSEFIMQQQNLNAIQQVTNANSLITTTTATENYVTAATTDNSNQASIAGGIANGATSGAMGGTMGGAAGVVTGAIAGGIAGGLTSSIAAEAASSNATIITQADTQVAKLTKAKNANNTRNSVSTSIVDTSRMCAARTNQTENSNRALQGQRVNNKNCNDTNADNMNQVARGNAQRTYDRETDNADKINQTALDNNDNEKTQGDYRADWSRQIARLNAKETLSAAQETQRNALRDARMANPVQLASPSGNGENWVFGTNGIQFRVRTQSDSAIKQTADYFARYGYAVNQQWNVTVNELNVMPKFTYWKADDIWVNVRNVANARIASTITDIFENGVTVWRAPDYIGKTGIYQ